MHPKPKKRSRPFMASVCGVLSEVFPLHFLRRFCARKRVRQSALKPKNPNEPDLYESRKPFSAANQPKTLHEAEARRLWNDRRIEDWRQRDWNYGSRGKTLLWDRIAEEVRNGTYDSRAHTYEGRVESVMGAAAKELLFLGRWIRRYQEKQDSERRRRRRERLSERGLMGRPPSGRIFKAKRPFSRPYPRGPHRSSGFRPRVSR